MATLTVWKFDDPAAADNTVAMLETLSKQELIRVHDAATVSWPHTAGKPKIRQLHNLTGAGALGGAFWGMLFGLIFFVPFLGAAVGAATGALGGKMSDVGIDDDLIKSARERITQGTSALFLLSSDAVQDKVKASLDGLGLKPELIQSNLSADQETALREMIAQ
ncbi:DUF1269 domain-containing protein [Amycolatopsis acidicola]|uniref:DUF1269 domain-containing protein n=1 Tax=Amycolatopsis acidicola TaxID=2596893 RepID=A0A5N0V9A7_9PSEU|nr:DUF1269 domain-containing protein [Amycolatopsis acidicola]KAA9162585.1 DUF1269 domain-containing protein [Amycolatopsis acidicola]